MSEPTGNDTPTVIDARGLRCPMPVIELQRVTRRCAPGTVLTLLSDDAAAAADVAAWCRMQGHELLETRDHPDGGSAYTLRTRA